MYDLIGDIHGHAAPLKALLEKLAYVEIDGVWQHPERQVIFLGDFVDRGPEQLDVIRIVKAMVEAGHAQTVMGNHEFNAVAWATPTADGRGFLRAHSDKNQHQHKAFLAQIGEGSERHRDVIEWFKTLPLFLDLDGIRVIHACWHSASLQVLADFTDEHIACLDYSIAASAPLNRPDDRKLCAYRWEGEKEIRQDNFISVKH